MLERNIFLLGRSSSTFQNYSRHVAAMALPFQCLPTELDPEQVKDYRDRGAVKHDDVAQWEFTRRFAPHILPQ